MNAQIKTAIQHWGYVALLLQHARNAKEFAAQFGVPTALFCELANRNSE